MGTQKLLFIHPLVLITFLVNLNALGMEKDSTYTFFRSPMLLMPKEAKAAPLSRPINQDYDFRYVELGGGTAVWQTSHEPKMINQQMALHFYAEYGDLQKPLSYVAGVNMQSSYVQEGFQLVPRYYFAHVKYTPTRLIYEWPVWFNIYGLAGASGWTSQLNYVGGDFQNFQGGRETDWGIGFVTGVGATVEFLSLTLSAQFSYFYGKGQYLAGAFEPQPVYTGAAQFNILVGYRFWLGESLWKCPTYK